MNEAESEDKIVASAPVPSVSNPHDQAVVLVFTPIFSNSQDSPDSTNLRGFGTGVYRVADFLAGLVERAEIGDISFRVVDVEDGGNGQEVFPVPNGTPDADWENGITHVAELDLAGRDWQLQFSRPTGYGITRLESQLWLIVLASGLIITGLATVSMYSLISGRLSVESDLTVMTNRMNILLNSALESILLVGVDDRIVWANQSYANVFGFAINRCDYWHGMGFRTIWRRCEVRK